MLDDEDDKPPTTPRTPSTPGSTRTARVREHFSRSRQWGYEGYYPPSWEFDKNKLKSPRGTYTEEDYRRLARPRAGYSAHGVGMGPAKKTSAAVVARDNFLKEKGYIDNPRALLHARFHGTSAEVGRKANSAQSSAQRANAERQHDDWLHEVILMRNLYRTGKPIPEHLMRRAVG